MNKLLLTIVLGLTLWLGIYNPTSIAAQEPEQSETFTAKITKVVEEKELDFEGKKQTYQKLEVTGIDKESKGQIIIIENGKFPVVNAITYKVNDKVMIGKQKDQEGNDLYVIEDTVRSDSLLLLFLVFLIVTVTVTGLRGISSMASMVFSFLVIFKFILPQISGGANPVLIATVGALIIIPVIFYMSHGFSSKTTLAICGTVIALTITGVLSSLFIDLTHLYGFSSEESGFLATMKNTIDMRGILLAGVVIGAMGVLDDVAVSQAAIVKQLKESNPKMKWGELYKRAMDIGQDHIASMINTLILVYTGASLPLLLIFINNPRPYAEIVNYEFIAEEVVKTLVGSIGLIAAVPITTVLAVSYFGRKRQEAKLTSNNPEI